MQIPIVLCISNDGRFLRANIPIVYILYKTEVIENSNSASKKSVYTFQAYDCRPVHGILQHIQLQQKVCATATLKYIAKCVSHPPMSFPQEEQGEKEQSETSTEGNISEANISPELFYASFYFLYILVELIGCKNITVADMETSSSSLTSFYMIRSCFLDLLRDWSSYSIPLTTLCELLLLIQVVLLFLLHVVYNDL